MAAMVTAMVTAMVAAMVTAMMTAAMTVTGKRRYWKKQSRRYGTNEREFANHLVLLFVSFSLLQALRN
jgi:hypothetical protein